MTQMRKPSESPKQTPRAMKQNAPKLEYNQNRTKQEGNQSKNYTEKESGFKEEFLVGKALLKQQRGADAEGRYHEGSSIRLRAVEFLNLAGVVSVLCFWQRGSGNEKPKGSTAKTQDFFQISSRFPRWVVLDMW